MLNRWLMVLVVAVGPLQAMHLWESASIMRRWMPRLLTPTVPGFHTAGVRWGTSVSTQIYTTPTYDAAFKWILDEDKVRLSFLHAFAAGVKIRSSERLDDHMNPLEKLQLLREFLHHGRTVETVKGLSSSGAYVMQPTLPGQKTPQRDDKATAFLHEMVGRFDEIKSSFPKPRYDGTMDFVCALDTGDYALVEMQVIPQDYWDRRALAYVAAFYGNQLCRGEHWRNIKKVMGINILGGGKDNKVHWVDTPQHFVRHYKFEDQLNGKGRFIDGIELIQYSIMNAPTMDTQEKQDWMTFLSNAHNMTEEQVKKEIKTPAVLKAFERAKIADLPARVREKYEAEDKEYDRFSEHTADLVKGGRKEGRAEGAEEERNKIIDSMIETGMNDTQILKVVAGLTPTQLQARHDALKK